VRVVSVTEQGIQLPNWTDSSSVVTFLTMALGIVTTILGFTNPGLFGVSAQDAVRQIIPIAGLVVTAVAGLFNSHRIAKVTTQVVASQAPIVQLTRQQAKVYRLKADPVNNVAA
jgi:hypothetical protein